MRQMIIGLVLLLATLRIVDFSVADDPVFKELTGSGVLLVSGESKLIPQPTLADGLTPAEQKKALKRAAGHFLLEEFTRKSVLAPFSLKIESLTDASGTRIAQSLNVWFVVYGDWQTLLDENLLAELGNHRKSKNEYEFRAEARSLKDDELTQRKLFVRASEDTLEKFMTFQTPLLDRVFVSGVIHRFQTTAPNSALFSSVLDPRFDSDGEFPNQWQSLIESETGDVILAQAKPYAGFGGYIKATKLVDPDGAILIEGHAIFNEPTGWFRGANLLKSKLPIMIQHEIRGLRRQLAETQK